MFFYADGVPCAYFLAVFYTCLGLLALVYGFLLCKTGVIDNVSKGFGFWERIYVMSAECRVLSEECLGGLVRCLWGLCGRYIDIYFYIAGDAMIMI